MIDTAEEALIAQWETLSGETPRRPIRRAAVAAPKAAAPLPDAELFALRQALHRGFRDAHRESYGTEFTAWETPLPQLTWAHQSVEKIKAWLEAGGLPWEVEAALKRRSKSAEWSGREEHAIGE